MQDSAHPSPDALLARYRARGDPNALGELFDAVAPSLYRVALSLLHDVHDADDALQSTFLALLRHPDRPDPSRPVVPWLVGVLQYEVLRLRRESRRKREPSSPAVNAEAATLLDNADVRKALEELPEPYRAPSLLRWRYGLSPAEIAHVRGEPPGTTRSLLARALARIRSRLRHTLAGAAPFAPGLGGVREALLEANARTAWSAARAPVRWSAMTTKRVLFATLIGVATLAVVAAWFATHPLGAQPPGEREANAAGTREAAQAPHVPLLSGPPADARLEDRVPAGEEVPATDRPVPRAAEPPLWPVPENLRGILDARVTTEALLEVITGVNQAFRSPAPVRLVEFNSSHKVTTGTARAETSSALDATTRALSALALPLLRPVEAKDLDRTTAQFWFRTAPPTQDVWEPGEDLSVEVLHPVIEAARAKSSQIGALQVDAAVGLQRRTLQVRVPELEDVLLLMRTLDEMRGVRVTRVQWSIHDSKGEVSANLEVALRRIDPPKPVRADETPR